MAKTRVTYQEYTVTIIDYNDNGSIKEIRKISRPQQAKNLHKSDVIKSLPDYELKMCYERLIGVRP